MASGQVLAWQVDRCWQGGARVEGLRAHHVKGLVHDVRAHLPRRGVTRESATRTVDGVAARTPLA